MPSTDELFGKEMSWPRLVIKFGVVAIVCYNFYNYNNAKKPDWECFATDKRQPNGDGIGENMTATFTNVIKLGFWISAISTVVNIIEMLNKKMKNKQLVMVVGILDTVIGLAAAVWLAYASWARLSIDGKICSGATTNVSEETYPYAYNQGAFLQVMLVLMYVIPPTLFVATNCGCL